MYESVIFTFFRLKYIREDNDYKQTDIVKLLRVTQAQYSRYESWINEILILKFIILAKFYNTLIDYIVGLTDKKIYKKVVNK